MSGPRSRAFRSAVLGATVALPLLAGCGTAVETGRMPPASRIAAPDALDPTAERRMDMVESQIAARGIRDPAVLQAMRTVPRHLFVPPSEREFAYTDGPLAIGEGQTISQPYIVALMTELIRPDRSMRVLEIGTGSGYQAAVLAECVGHVFSIEILPDLSSRAALILQQLGYRNISLRVGDGYDGWPGEAPFDGILVTAAPDKVPQPLLDQLADGGRLVIPIGSGSQDLMRITRTRAGFQTETIAAVRFVPMTGKADSP